MTAIDACYCEEEFLTRLDDALNSPDLGDDDAGAAAAQVTSVDLSGNKINATVCTDIAWKYLGQCRNLKELDLKANAIGPVGWSALCHTLRSTCVGSLEHLDVSENGIFDEGLYDVAKLLVEAKSLRFLSLVTNSLSPRGIPTLCDGLRHCHLTTLLVDYNALGDDGARMICESVSQLPSLQKLGLSDNSIGDAGATAVATLLLSSSRCRLEWINLSCNLIGDAGMHAIGDALTAQSGNRCLRNLDLSCNPNTTSRGAALLLANSNRWVALRSVELCSMSLEDDHAKALTAAISDPLSSLRYVEYFNNPALSEPVEHALVTAMDACEKVDAPVAPFRGTRCSAGWCAGAAVVAAGIALGSIAFRRWAKAQQH